MGEHTSEQLRQRADRLDVLANAVTETNWSEFSMRIPVEPDRDADCVLSSAARELRAYAALLDRQAQWPSDEDVERVVDIACAFKNDEIESVDDLYAPMRAAMQAVAPVQASTLSDEIQKAVKDALEGQAQETRSAQQWAKDMAPALAGAQASAVPDAKPLPELMMASYHEAVGWNACREAMLSAAPQPPKDAQPVDVAAIREVVAELREEANDDMPMEFSGIPTIFSELRRLADKLTRAIGGAK